MSARTEMYDTPGIAIDPIIRDSFPCVDELLQELVAEKKGIFQEPAFHDFFSAPSTRLVFSDSALPAEIGAFSLHAGFEDDGYFHDTIFLNSSLFRKISREYLISVIIHESLHAYITWCFVCYAYNHRNGVDAAYLKKHFHSHWEWLTLHDPYIINEQQHELMSENFIKMMERALYLHTNPWSDPELRDKITKALTWGGLNKTRQWARLGDDTCRLHSIDIWSRNIDADMHKVVDFPNCTTITTKHFLDSLQLQPLCKSKS
jgi:hypothetical protein